MSPYKDPEVHRQYRLARTAKNLEFLRQYKTQHGCADCGWNEHHAGLEFDHIKGKYLNVVAMTNHSRARLLEEIEKCEVVCGTCHNLRTWNRRQEVDTAL